MRKNRPQRKNTKRLPFPLSTPGIILQTNLPLPNPFAPLAIRGTSRKHNPENPHQAAIYPHTIKIYFFALLFPSAPPKRQGIPSLAAFLFACMKSKEFSAIAAPPARSSACPFSSTQEKQHFTHKVCNIPKFCISYTARYFLSCTLPAFVLYHKLELWYPISFR